jgi:hypothetical protein
MPVSKLILFDHCTIFIFSIKFCISDFDNDLNSCLIQKFLKLTLSKTTQKFLGLNEFSSNQEIIKSVISKYPGLRFHEIKKETKLANGTLQHHLGQMTKSNTLKSKYIDTIPRYYAYDLEDKNHLILLRLRQRTTSRIIKTLLKNECQTFGQLVKFSKKSPGTVSIYKNMLLKDSIIVGDTNSCDCTKNIANTSIKYRLVDPEKVRMLVEEYGKSTLRQSADNLADIFLSLK